MIIHQVFKAFSRMADIERHVSFQHIKLLNQTINHHIKLISSFIKYFRTNDNHKVFKAFSGRQTLSVMFPFNTLNYLIKSIIKLILVICHVFV